jgi:Photosynthetic reaction centre cytochrome C subunit
MRVTGRFGARLSAGATALTFVAALGARMTASTQQPPAPPPAQQPAAQQATDTPKGPTAAEKFKNIQVLKDVPADQVQPSMQFITAALGVQCDFCHVINQFDKDDKRMKQTARDMMRMVTTINQRDFEGRNRIDCASCHHGRQTPDRIPPLAAELTPAEAAAFERARQQRMQQIQAGQPGQPGAPGQPQPAQPAAAATPPAQTGAAGQPGQPGQPAGQPGAGPGRGGQPGQAGPPRPTETLDQVIDKYVQAIGGREALEKITTRVMTGTVTDRAQQTSPFTVQEKLPASIRVESTGPRGATVARVSTGSTGWAQTPQGTRDLEGWQLSQAGRQADLGLPLALKQRYTNLRVVRYGTMDGKDTIVLVGNTAPEVNEQLQFDKESGLLLRRTITTRTPLGQLPEQIDYSDYRDASGVKTPFQIRYATWQNVQTEKFTDVKVNAPVDDTLFARPAPKPGN